MKKIGNFTQTYQGTVEWSPNSDGKNRDFLIDAFCNDENKKKAYNMLDLKTFSFHNVELEKAKKLCEKLKSIIPNILCTCYYNISFSECIYKQLLFLKEKGMTDFLWVQDDEFFTYSNFDDYVKFYNFYKENDKLNNVSLCMPLEDVVFNNTDPLEIIKIPHTDLNLYKFETKKLQEKTRYPMNFTAFICNIDYFLNNMFDLSYLSILDAYQLEASIAFKAGKNNVNRYCLKKPFFESFNVVGLGGSLGDSAAKREKMKKMFNV